MGASESEKERFSGSCLLDHRTDNAHRGPGLRTAQSPSRRRGNSLARSSSQSARCTFPKPSTGVANFSLSDSNNALSCIKAAKFSCEDIAVPTLDPRQHTQPDQVPVVPLEYAGQWLAWTRDLKRIVAHGTTLDEVAQFAQQAGESDVVFEKVPRPNSFVGC